MKKNIILSFILLVSLCTTNSMFGQHDKDSKHSSKKKKYMHKSYAPTKGKYTVAINFGRGTHITSGLNVPASFGSVSGSSSFTNVSLNANDATNMIGAEGRYYIADKFAITLSGAASFRNNPASLNVPAVRDANGSVVIPAYNAVVSDSRSDINIAIGAQWAFDVKSKQLFPYLGFAIPFSYARRSLYDPTILEDGTIVDLTARHANVSAIGAQAVAGVDYYFSNNFYLGASVRPLSFTYITNSKIPGAALPASDAASYTISSFVQPMLSIGFRF